VTGQQRRVTTEGGTMIELNTQTSIDIRLSAGGTERIELIAGEAAIATAANASRSIMALAGDGRATATDATFNMRRSGASVCVTCVTGVVLVEYRGRPVRLQQRQQVSYSDEGMGTPVEVDPVGVTAWQDGILVFHDEPLGRVIEEVNRYWPGRIIVANANLGERLVTARFKLDHLEDVITQIKLVFHANVTRLPGGVVVLSS
jgi:transmembrane sensor